jgi:hypothetical protein
LAWLVVPLAAIIIFRSTVYDAWRQMYFLYTSILLIAVFGMKTVYGQLSALFRHRIGFKILAAAVLMAGLLEPIIFAIQYHPFENVFFNVFAGNPKTLRQNFELDYWGLSYKQGIDYVLAHDPSDKINLDITDPPEREYIQYMLAPEQASRLVPTPLEESDYFISAFRWHPQDYEYGTKYFFISVKGIEIMAVYKLR